MSAWRKREFAAWPAARTYFSRRALGFCWILSVSFLQVPFGCFAISAEEHARSELSQFISDYRCMVTAALKMVSERGVRGKSRDRFMIIDIAANPQRFVQCILVELDTKLLCEASSGRYGPPKGDKDALVLSSADESTLKSLGFESPYGVANFHQEISLGIPPDFESVASHLLETMYLVYGARDEEPMSLYAPTVSKDRVRLSSCKPVS